MIGNLTVGKIPNLIPLVNENVKILSERISNIKRQFHWVNFKVIFRMFIEVVPHV